MSDFPNFISPEYQLAQRNKLWALLGDMPDRHAPSKATLVRETEQDGFIQEDWLFEWNEMEPVPGVFFKPCQVKPPFPAVLYNHAHGGDYTLGKKELFEGRDALRGAYGAELTKLGFAVLSIDAWCFGERRGRSESAVFKEMLWKGKVLWGMMVFDTLKAFDYLAAREDILADSIVSMGISMGGTMALWSTALEPRIKACIDLCSLCEYEALIAQQNMDKHGIYYYVPSLLKHFSAADLNTLTLPRPRLCVIGRHDGLTPIHGAEVLDKLMRVQADSAGHQEGWNLLITETGHFETEYSHQQVLSFLSGLQQA